MSTEHTTPIDDGGPAFPHTELVQDICGPDGHVNRHRVYPAMPGMSLRDWFAGQALQQFANQRDYNIWELKRSAAARAEIATAAYNIADAMLAARTQTKTTP